ncbi:MAG TPA: TonB family protein [Pyrinomonadaceae bacterium]
MRLASILFASSLSLSSPHAPRAGAREAATPVGQTSAAQATQGPTAPEQAAVRDEIKSLLLAVGGERKKDADAWYRLGVAYQRAGEVAEARKAFKQAVKLRKRFVAARVGVAYTYLAEKNYVEAEKEAKQAADLAIDTRDFRAYGFLSNIRLQRYRETSVRISAQADKVLATRPDDAEWRQLKAQALIGLTISESQQSMPDLSEPPPPPSPPPPPDEAKAEAARERNLKLYKEAAEHLDAYLRLSPKAPDAAYQRAQLAALRFHVLSLEDGPAHGVFKPKELTSKAVLLKRPEPGYTPEARAADISGMISARVLLGADGAVKHILIVKPLSHGLTERALDAARRIKFKPAVKDGRPVSQWVIVEYHFNIY